MRQDHGRAAGVLPARYRCRRYTARQYSMCDRRGAIGLLMVQLARLSGAAKVILSEPVELRRSAGLSVGADLAVDPLREDLSRRVRGCGQKAARMW